MMGDESTLSAEDLRRIETLLADEELALADWYHGYNRAPGEDLVEMSKAPDPAAVLELFRKWYVHSEKALCEAICPRWCRLRHKEIGAHGLALCIAEALKHAVHLGPVPIDPIASSVVIATKMGVERMCKGYEGAAEGSGAPTRAAPPPHGPG